MSESDTYNNQISSRHPNLFCPEQRSSNPKLRKGWDRTFKAKGCKDCEEWSNVLGRCWIGGCDIGSKEQD